MLLLRLPGVLSEHRGFRSRVAQHRTWRTARKTASGREMVENDPELKEILKARKPTPYNEIIRRAFNSDPRYAGQTLDDSYSNSGSSSSASDSTEISLPPTAFHHEPID